jgi:diadenosine tetraphosphate (Ap4A) HIT family hydrolase
MIKTLDNMFRPFNCDFCNEFSGGEANAYAVRYGRHPTARTILDWGAFRVVPSLGQLTEGHLLILPSAHICAIADLPNEHFAQLEALRVQVRAALRTVYGSCIFFEHGIRGEGSGGCGIDHAHMHAVPAAADSVVSLLYSSFAGSPVQEFSDLNECVSQNSSYLFFESSLQQRHVFPVTRVASQYLRKLVADEIGNTNWDWRKTGYELELVHTMRRLAPMLSLESADRV